MGVITTARIENNDNFKEIQKLENIKKKLSFHKSKLAIGKKGLETRVVFACRWLIHLSNSGIGSNNRREPNDLLAGERSRNVCFILRTVNINYTLTTYNSGKRVTRNYQPSTSAISHCLVIGSSQSHFYKTLP